VISLTKLAPSVLGADFSKLRPEIESAVEAGADLLHLDIMDGHFVPNFSFGPGILKTIDSITDIFLDVHLMLSEPEKYFEPFAKAGADLITFHIEARPEPVKLARQLRKMGIKAGISINPDTDVEKVLPFLSEFDLLLVMSVFPGFGGQSFIESALDSVAKARKFIDENSLETVIEVDGGVDRNNAARVVEAGTDWLVMGSAFFGAEDRRELAEFVHGIAVAK
jgi:ribulose-phosphate 3-epimerase